MPWANGLGTTLELAISPPGASMSDFEWRVSIATVTAPGPFSHLPEIDRVLLMLDDVEAELVVDGRAMHLRQFDQIAFSGDAEVALTSISAPARDLNAMTRRGAWTSRLTRVQMRPSTAYPVEDVDVSFLLLAEGRASVRQGDDTAWLEPLDLLLLEPGMSVSGDGTAIRIDATPTP